MRSCLWKLSALAMLVLLAGCRADEGGKSPGDGPPSRGTIGLSVMTLTNPFFKVIADTLTDEARKYGYEVVVTSGEFDVARQRNQVKDFIVRKVSAIVLCPTDSKAIGTAIQEANQAGIPVFTADLACLAPGAKVVSHIATDNYAGGKEAGRAMIEALGEAGGKVVVLHYEQAESCLLRVQGFTEIVDEYNQGAGRAESTSWPCCRGEGPRTAATRPPRTPSRPIPTWPGSSPSTTPRRWGPGRPWRRPARPTRSGSSALTANPRASRRSRTG